MSSHLSHTSHPVCFGKTEAALRTKACGCGSRLRNVKHSATVFASLLCSLLAHAGAAFNAAVQALSSSEIGGKYKEFTRTNRADFKHTGASTRVDRFRIN